MNDVISKINALLSDEESVKHLSELAEMIKNENNEGNHSSKDDDSFQPDMTKIIKLTSLIGEIKQDKNTELLLALKPHLGSERQERIDKAVKILKMLSVWNAAKENGLLQDLI